MVPGNAAARNGENARQPGGLPERNSIRTLAAGGERSIRGRPVNRESALARNGPGCGNGTCCLRWAEPEVVFRIVHVALDNGFSPRDGLPPSYREQAVEIALGPNPSFQNGHVTALTRRVPVDCVVNVVLSSRRRARCRSRKPVGPPRIVETLHKAVEWRRQLDAGEVPNQAAIASREGITRARVSQILMLLRLAPEIRERILRMPETTNPPRISERSVRPVAPLEARCAGAGEENPSNRIRSPSGTYDFRGVRYWAAD